MERLTERDEYGDIYVKEHDYIKASHRLAKYEDAEENGLLVRLPCKVGAAVYGIQYNTELERMYIKEWKVESFEVDELGDVCMDLIDAIGARYYNENIYDFGTHYFLTREEAEQALKARADNG